MKNVRKSIPQSPQWSLHVGVSSFLTLYIDSRPYMLYTLCVFRFSQTAVHDTDEWWWNFWACKKLKDLMLLKKKTTKGTNIRPFKKKKKKRKPNPHSVFSFFIDQVWIIRPRLVVTFCRRRCEIQRWVNKGSESQSMIFRKAGKDVTISAVKFFLKRKIRRKHIWRVLHVTSNTK